MKNHIALVNLWKICDEIVITLAVRLAGKNALRRYLKGSEQPFIRQKQLLQDILSRNAKCAYGIKHHFSEINTFEAFQRRVPVNSYEDLRPWINRTADGEANCIIVGKPEFFATTSGSTGQPKLIPLTTRINTQIKQYAMARAYISWKNSSKTFAGKILPIGSPAVEGKTPGGITFGSMAGLMEIQANRVIRRRYALPTEVSDIKDRIARYYAILRLGLDQPVSLIWTPNPSTLIVLAKYLNLWKNDLLNDLATGQVSRNFDFGAGQSDIFSGLQPNGSRATDLQKQIEAHPENRLTPAMLWPNLATIWTWTGGNCSNYSIDLPEFYGEKVVVIDPGYLASEMRGSIPLRAFDNSGVLAINDNVYEFVETDKLDQPEYLNVKQVEIGKQYYIYITNYCGLYRYNMEDIIEVTGYYHQIPEIRFVQKGKGITSLTGEKLYEQQLLSAFANPDIQAYAPEFHISYADISSNGYHTLIESDLLTTRKDAEQLARMIDERLQAINCEYMNKRQSHRLNPLIVHKLVPGSHEVYRNWRVAGGVRDNQFKFSHLETSFESVGPLQIADLPGENDAVVAAIPKAEPNTPLAE